jgi:hypothetical protein
MTTYNVSCGTVFHLVPDLWSIQTNMIYTGVILVVNTFLAIVFFQRKYRSPVTIFLAVLAITDCLTAVFASIPNVVGYYFKYGELERTSDSYWKGWSWKRKFPLCLILYTIEDFMYVFHMSSILITTCLCIQKAIVLKYPLWSKINLNKKSSVLITVVVITCVVAFNIQSTVHGVIGIYRGENDECCHSEKQMYMQRTFENVCESEDHLTATGIVRNSTPKGIVRNYTPKAIVRNSTPKGIVSNYTRKLFHKFIRNKNRFVLLSMG